MRFHQFQEAEHNARAAQWRRIGPSRGSSLGAGNRSSNVFYGCQLDLSRNFTGCGVINRLRFISLARVALAVDVMNNRSEEHTAELQSRGHLVCRLLLEKKNITIGSIVSYR